MSLYAWLQWQLGSGGGRETVSHSAFRLRETATKRRENRGIPVATRKKEHGEKTSPGKGLGDSMMARFMWFPALPTSLTGLW